MRDLFRFRWKDSAGTVWRGVQPGAEITRMMSRGVRVYRSSIRRVK